MKTRMIVSALTAGALVLGSVSSFAASGLPSTWQGVAPSEPQAGQTQINNPHPQYEGQWQGQQWQRGQQVQRNQQWQRNEQSQRNQQWQRGQEARHEHERHEHHDRDYRNYAWQQPDYAYQQPAYVYQQGYYAPGYYQQPYYGYDNSDDGSNLVLGTIIGGLIGGAIANSR
jgi:hypothetical protein